MYVCIFLYVYMYACLPHLKLTVNPEIVCTYLLVCMHVCMGLHVCMYAFMIQIRECVCRCMFLCVHVHTIMYSYVRVCIHTRAGICVLFCMFYTAFIHVFFYFYFYFYIDFFCFHFYFYFMHALYRVCTFHHITHTELVCMYVSQTRRIYQ